MQPSHAQLSSSVDVPWSFLNGTVDDGDLGFMRVEVASRQITYANPRFCDMIGVSLEEIVARKLNVFELTHPEDVKKSVDWFDRLAADEIETYAIEKRYLLSDRTALPIRGHVAVCDRDNDSRARVIMAVVRDLSISSSTHQFVDREPRRHGAYFWTHDLLTDRRTCSDGFRSLLGLPEAGPAPSLDEYVSCVHPDDRRRVIEENERKVKGMLRSSEHRIVHPTGEVRWVTHTIKPIFDASGRVVQIVGTCLDFTESRFDPSYSGNTVRIIKAYIDAQWYQPLNVDQLAKAVDINPRTLFKHCKRSWGLTPHEYLKSVRLKHARAMLETADGSATVLGIALKCGFQSQGHFARDYRLAFGERPSDTLNNRRRLPK